MNATLKLLTGEAIHQTFSNMHPEQGWTWIDTSEDIKEAYNDLAQRLNLQLNLCESCGNRPADGYLHLVAGNYFCTSCITPPPEQGDVIIFTIDHASETVSSMVAPAQIVLQHAIAKLAELDYEECTHEMNKAGHIAWKIFRSHKVHYYCDTETDVYELLEKTQQAQLAPEPNTSTTILDLSITTLNGLIEWIMQAIEYLPISTEAKPAIDILISTQNKLIQSQQQEAIAKLATTTKRPHIVCLCGSTRFYQAFQDANLRETLAGRIVLTIGCDTKSDTDLLGASDEQMKTIKHMLDELHLSKIDLADEILVLNVGGYIGESTSRELAHALRTNKQIRCLEDPLYEYEVKPYEAGSDGENQCFVDSCRGWPRWIRESDNPHYDDFLLCDRHVFSSNV